MRGFESFHFSIESCKIEIQKFKVLLQKDELRERDDILPFFKENKHLSAFLGVYHPEIINFDLIKHEFCLFGDFYADLVVGDSEKSSFCFIEFEDARKESIFKKNFNKSTLEWSPRFEHGFSQLVDWFWRIDDYRRTQQLKNIFGNDESFSFTGLLIIGRDSFLAELEKARLKWRLEKVLIDSRKVNCITFDQLLSYLEERLLIYSGAYCAEEEAKDE